MSRNEINQLGRRNLTQDQIAHLRGQQYLHEKKSIGRPENNVANFTTLRTEDKLAKQHKVSPKTIRNDAAFADALNTIAELLGEEIRQAILAR